MSEKIKDIGTFLLVILSTVGGFFLGKKQTLPAETVVKNVAPEPVVSVVEFEEVSKDTLLVRIPDNVRVIWSEGKNSVEKSGQHSIPLGQVDTVHSKKFWNFPYVGNAKTRKFYPSRSYPARGTELRYRRFFDSKKSALAAGFIASKLVK